MLIFTTSHMAKSGRFIADRHFQYAAEQENADDFIQVETVCPPEESHVLEPLLTGLRSDFAAAGETRPCRLEMDKSAIRYGTAEKGRTKAAQATAEQVTIKLQT
ncbi:MAG: hypothetical protein OXC66_02170 [Roseovarius sp.]|nr:hypothetical protein [Roseovarius sp.]